MPILAIDTALDACSAALLAGGEVLAERIEPMATGHAEAFFGILDEVFRDAGVKRADVAAIGVTVGPGSFTGIRVGLAAARGLALALSVPAHGVTTFQPFAEPHRAGHPDFAVLIDARRGAFYRQRFLNGVPGAAEIVPVAAPLEGLDPDTALAGPAASAVALEGHAVLAGAPHLPVAAVARLVVAGRGLLPSSPLYLREADAKPQGAAVLARR
ncbi:MAG: tRNA (adenosine(37)-N6)-threonylcarbamoyltransferase complex dimerization subunit type 1 TsaB [Flavobacteriaceae bacterium]